MVILSCSWCGKENCRYQAFARALFCLTTSRRRVHTFCKLRISRSFNLQKIMDSVSEDKSCNEYFFLPVALMDLPALLPVGVRDRARARARVSGGSVRGLLFIVCMSVSEKLVFISDQQGGSKIMYSVGGSFRMKVHNMLLSVTNKISSGSRADFQERCHSVAADN